MSNINEKEGKLTDVNVSCLVPDLQVTIPLKWRKVITEEVHPVGEIVSRYHETTLPVSHDLIFIKRSFEEWQENKGAMEWSTLKRLTLPDYYLQTSRSLIIRKEYLGNYEDNGVIIDQYMFYGTPRYLYIKRTTFEVDMSDLGEKLRKAADPEVYELIGIVWQNTTYKTDFKDWKNIITLEDLSDAWKTSKKDTVIFEFRDDGNTMEYKEVEKDGIKFRILSGMPQPDLTPPIKNCYFHYNPDPPDPWDWEVAWSTSMPSSITALFRRKPVISIGSIVRYSDGDLDETGTDTDLRTDVQTTEDDSIDTDKGSQEEGLNRIRIGRSFSDTRQGTQVFNFDSVYLSTDTINQFIANEGGIVSDGGVFPNSDAIFVSSITRSLDGNSMEVVQVSKFDSTPKLNVGDRVYGYIKDKCVFGGYVLSMNRRLTSSGEEIVFYCVDLKILLNQFAIPIYFKYRPPSKSSEGTRSLRSIINELLIKTGVTTFVNELPQITCPSCEFLGENLRNVLEWACNHAGNYVYYTDRHGKLYIVPFSGRRSKSYTIGVISDISVSSFQPVKDMSLSRSKIVLLGDFEMKEMKHIYNFNTSNFVKVEKEDMIHKNLTSGLYYYEVVYPGLLIQHPFAVLTPPRGWVIMSSGFTKPDLPEVRCLKIGTMLLQSEIEKYENTAPKCNVAYVNSDPGESRMVVDKISSPRFPLGLYLKQYRYAKVYLQARYLMCSQEPIKVEITFSDRVGGTEVIRDPRFKKITTSDGAIDDTSLMQEYINMLADYFKVREGGHLVLDGLDSDLELLDEVTITGGAQDFKGKVMSITYNILNKTTEVQLGGYKYRTLPYFDPAMYRKRKDNEFLVKIGMLEASELYKSRD